MDSVFYAAIACGWTALAAIEFYEKRRVSGIFQTGLALFHLMMVYLCSK